MRFSSVAHVTELECACSCFVYFGMFRLTMSVPPISYICNIYMHWEGRVYRLYYNNS